MRETKIAVIGLGYVGLPLAVEFGKKYRVVGYDIKPVRINELNEGYDRTLEINDRELKGVIIGKGSPGNSKNGLFFTSSIDDIRNCNYFIITVPTPVDKYNKPDLTLLYKASETVGKVPLKKMI